MKIKSYNVKVVPHSALKKKMIFLQILIIVLKIN